MSEAEDFELLVSGEGMGDEPRKMRIPVHGSVRDVIAFSIEKGLPASVIEEVAVFIEDGDHELAIDAILVEVGIEHHHHLHCHRCRKIETVISSGEGTEIRHKFLPAATALRVREWVAQQLDQPTERFTLRTRERAILPDGRPIGCALHGENCELPIVLVDTEGASSHIVKVYNEDSGRPKFLYGMAATLISSLIDEVYRRFDVERRQDDRLRCDCSGEDVFGFSSLTFGDYVCSGHCPELTWLFSSGTGGA